MKKIIYPGTFDPITNGHINIVERAALLFDKVVITIARSKQKAPFFSFEDRVDLCNKSLAHIDNIEVCGFSGLIVEQIKKHNAVAVLRGIRSMTDFDYELQMAGMNQALYPEFDTVFLTPADHLAFISSTLVREIALMQGDVSKFVPSTVNDALLDRCKQKS
jgi:pantetheine-phosphate adenylyltransferase